MCIHIYVYTYIYIYIPIHTSGPSNGLTKLDGDICSVYIGHTHDSDICGDGTMPLAAYPNG